MTAFNCASEIFREQEASAQYNILPGLQAQQLLAHFYTAIYSYVRISQIAVKRHMICVMFSYTQYDASEQLYAVSQRWYILTQ